MDGVALSGYSNQEAVEILKHTGSKVKLTIVRYLRGLKFEELRAGICQANIGTPSSGAEDQHSAKVCIVAIVNVIKCMVKQQKV